MANTNVRAFLRVIRAGEGTADEDGYRRQFGGELFTDFSRHPNRAITKTLGDKQLTSTAAGAYQFLGRTWSECQAALNLPDFSPASQDLAAVFLIARRKGLEHAIAGRLEQAIAACANEWASLPGSPYGQPTKTLAQCHAVYKQHGGTYAPAAPIPPGDPGQYSQEGGMPIPALVTALLPSVIAAIPRLAQIFKPGSEVAERNVAAASAVMDIVTQATGSVNAQAAVEKLQTDPAAVAAATKAVESNWFQLAPADGGGIAGARQADAAMSGNDMMHSPSFWVAIALLPLVYMIVGSVVGLFGTPWSEDVRSAIANGVVGMVIGALAGYYFGQTTSRNRTQAP
ncbi:MAG: glycoside hydrolase family 104 protein [Betaproteobacteria bacterium]|nr:glycoside hydrolase family 104 protein [Betaproteobacteria bacterium]